MIVIGAGGMACQLFEDILEVSKVEEIVFWSEIKTKYSFIWENFRVLTNDEEVKEYFNTRSRDFIVAVSSIDARKQMTDKFISLGGELNSFISPRAVVSPYAKIGNGVIIVQQAVVETFVTIEDGVVINGRAGIGHGTFIKRNAELAPDSFVLGDVEIGENCFIGARAILFPKIIIGNNAVISAGSIVRKNVPANSLVAGVPGKVIKTRKV